MCPDDFGVVPVCNVHLPGDVIGRVLEDWHLGSAFGKKKKDRLAMLWGPPGGCVPLLEFGLGVAAGAMS